MNAVGGVHHRKRRRWRPASFDVTSIVLHNVDAASIRGTRDHLGSENALITTVHSELTSTPSTDVTIIDLRPRNPRNDRGKRSADRDRAVRPRELVDVAQRAALNADLGELRQHRDRHRGRNSVVARYFRTTQLLAHKIARAEEFDAR
jgi:hypothetical protein